MAIGAPTTDRRAFLAAAPALALITAGPAAALALPTTTSDAAWNAAMDRYQAAQDRYRHFDKTVHDPLWKAQDAFEARHGFVRGGHNYLDRLAEFQAKHGTAHEVPEHVDEELDRLSNEESEAEDALMQMLAPNLAALKWKLEKIFRDDGEQHILSWSFAYLAQTMADYRRLLVS